MGGHIKGRNALVVSAMAAVMGLPGVVAASSAVAREYSDADAALGKRLDVTLIGSLTSNCALGGGGDIDFGELTGGETAVAQMSLDCNVPFDLTLTSARGGLAHVTLPQGQGPFAGVLPYDVRLTAPVLRPEPAIIESRFNSIDLRSKRTLSSGDAIAAGGARLEIQTGAVTGAGLLAGDYTETLTVTLTPRV